MWFYLLFFQSSFQQLLSMYLICSLFSLQPASLRPETLSSSSQILVMKIFRGHSLTCHRAEYQIGNECCPMCPAGKIQLNVKLLLVSVIQPGANNAYQNQPVESVCLPLLVLFIITSDMKGFIPTINDTSLCSQHTLYSQDYVFSFNRNIILDEIKSFLLCSTGSRVKTDCTEFRSTSCLPCIESTFMNQPTGLKQCFPCTSCVAGRFQLIFPNY